MRKYPPPSLWYPSRRLLGAASYPLQLGGRAGRRVRIQRVEDGLVALLEVVALHLEGWREHAVVDAPRLALEVQLLDPLKPLEPRLRRHGRDLLADGLVQPRRRGGLAQHLGHLGRGGGGGGPSGDLFGVRNCDCDKVGLERVAVHKQLREQRAAKQRRLDLLRGDVLALRELEDVFLTVDDAQAPLCRPSPNVARVEPAGGVERLARLLLQLVVAPKHARASHAHLAARRVGGARVAHLTHILQLELAAQGGHANVEVGHVVWVADRRRRRGLRQPVPLDELRADCDAEKVFDVGGDRRGAAEHLRAAV
mmetsp:Transcript_17137/g.56251  ORF Transcript_17137/g.56251 Transcript_17137/m.56251 type:complete len:310 (-) Transcript_17137:1189-2118(-)